MMHVRPQIADQGKEALFVKVDGEALRPGTIGKRVSQYFSQAGIRKDVRVTATNQQKMVSDKAFEMSPTKKPLIHSHMKHQESTADTNYIIKLNADRASCAHALMTDINESGDTPKSKHQASSTTSSKDNKDDDVPLGVVISRSLLGNF